MLLKDLMADVVARARDEVLAGRYSERGLARLAGLSQPHLHNLLHGVRSLSPQSADAILRALGLTVPEVLWRLPSRSEWAAVPLVRGRLGPGAEVHFGKFDGFAPFPARLVESSQDPIAAVLAPDPAMPDELKPGDLVLLDRNPERRRTPTHSRCFVIAAHGTVRIRTLRLHSGKLIAGREQIALRGRNILDIVRARVVWISRKIEEAPSGPSGPSGAGD